MYIVKYNKGETSQNRKEECYGEMIKTLTLHNNDTTPRHNGVGPTHGPHSIVP
jgi:hypothetical protein